MSPQRWICGTAWRVEDHWGFWLRVFGYGVAVSTERPLFSERMGLRDCVRVFGIKVEWLTP